jgi:hypothetical protein
LKQEIISGEHQKRVGDTDLWSMIRTLTPFLASALAAMSPAGPAPMINTSTSHSLIVDVGIYEKWRQSQIVDGKGGEERKQR